MTAKNIFQENTESIIEITWQDPKKFNLRKTQTKAYG